MKDLLICALEKNAEKLQIWTQDCLYLSYKISGLSYNMDLVSAKITEESVEVLRPKTFFRKEQTRTVYITKGFEYYIRYCGEKIEITKEEYDKIIKIRKDKLKEKQIQELEKLCNK